MISVTSLVMVISQKLYLMYKMIHIFLLKFLFSLKESQNTINSVMFKYANKVRLAIILFLKSQSLLDGVSVR